MGLTPKMSSRAAPGVRSNERHHAVSQRWCATARATSTRTTRRAQSLKITQILQHDIEESPQVGATNPFISQRCSVRAVYQAQLDRHTSSRGAVRRHLVEAKVAHG